MNLLFMIDTLIGAKFKAYICCVFAVSYFPQPVKVGHTTGSGTPTLFEQWCGFFYVPQEQISESAVRRDLQFFVLIRED